MYLYVCQYTHWHNTFHTYVYSVTYTESKEKKRQKLVFFYMYTRFWISYVRNTMYSCCSAVKKTTERVLWWSSKAQLQSPAGGCFFFFPSQHVTDYFFSRKLQQIPMRKKKERRETVNQPGCRILKSPTVCPFTALLNSCKRNFPINNCK